MVKLKAIKTNSDIIISQDSFEYLLNCLDNQKFIHDVNADGISEGVDSVRKLQSDHQNAIDNFNRQCRKILNS